VLEAELGQVHERAAAQVFDERDAVALRECCQLGQLGLADEPLHAEIAAMHTQDRAHLAAMARKRALVVAQVRAVRGPHLDQLAAAHLHDLGHAERAADLHQLAARDQHLAALGECRQHEQDRGSTVVHDARRLGAREPREPTLAAQAAVATLAVRSYSSEE
jgi:hypothetical protein